MSWSSINDYCMVMPVTPQKGEEMWLHLSFKIKERSRSLQIQCVWKQQHWNITYCTQLLSELCWLASTHLQAWFCWYSTIRPSTDLPLLITLCPATRFATQERKSTSYVIYDYDDYESMIRQGRGINNAKILSPYSPLETSHQRQPMITGRNGAWMIMWSARSS